MFKIPVIGIPEGLWVASTPAAESPSCPAHVVIALGADGRLHLRSFVGGALDSSYANRSDSVLQQVPSLLKELRDQLGLPQPG